MKKLSFFLFSLMSFVFLFSNCGSDNDLDLDNTTNSLVGRWHLVKTVQEFTKDAPMLGGQSISFDAKSLGTYWDITETTVTIHSSVDKESDGMTFTYKLNGNIASVPGQEQYEIVKVNAHELILKTEVQKEYSSLYSYFEK